MVEWRTTKRAKRVDGGNHHEQMGLKRISCASQFTIPNMGGKTPDLVGKNIDIRSSKLY